MTEEVKATTETETETTAKPEAEKVYKQADVDSITEKVRAGERARADRAEKALADMRAKNESEAEKAARELKESSDKAVAEARDSAKKQARLMGALQARGLTEAQAEWWADKAGPDWTTAEDAIKTLQEVAGLQLQTNTTRAPGGGGGRNQSPQPSEPYGFDADGVNKAKADLSASEYVTWYNKNREAIAAGNGLSIKKHPGIPGAMTPADGARR